MITSLSLICSALASFRNRSIRLKGALTALLFLLPLLGAHGFAQTTVISGTVYDPRTTASSLPLPNVLVYVTTGAVAPLPSGVQCLTTSSPTGVVGFTYSAADGTFTIGNVPVNATYTVVIQAGKWLRQFPETVAAVPLTGLALHMPSDHLQGDIPMIAIATGSVDAVECVLLDMGIAPTEFTDDNGTINLGGHIHLYTGTSSAGAQINASTPSQSALMTDSTTMNGYDMVMFPCQGNSSAQATLTGATNLLGYANAGGRVFATHYSYAWLDPDSPYDSQFPAVANWTTLTEAQIATGVGTVNTSFNDGATLAQWLQNAGATLTGTGDQIDIGTLRTDVASVIAPTQSWVTLSSGTYGGQTGNPVMQMTFNTPVGAAASSQCGRVMYNDYHIYNASSAGFSYNAALPNGQTFSECSPQPHTMTAQEEMLEYALFDLSSFVTPVVVPTLSVTYSPSPLIVKQGDTADQVTINVTNTSATTQIYSSVVLTLTLPTGLTATALSDSTGGWTCKVGTLTCTRTTAIAASASDSVTLTVSVPPYTSGSATTGLINATASSPNFSNNVTASDTVIFQQPPAITWAAPANIVYGTALSATQLNASSPVAGSFSYSPAAGTVLSVGAHTLTATFTPTDTTDYTTSTATVTLTVIPITPTLGLTSNANPVFFSNAVTFTASIASNATPPTGSVAFYDGTTQIGTGTVSGGVATFTTTTLSAQVHSITAAYSGDSSYGPATSGVLSETVVDFTIAPVGSGTVSSTASGLASFPLVVTPVGGPTLPGTMTLKVTGLSVGSIATFSPATVTVGSGTTAVTLQVQLPGSAALERPARPFAGGTLPIAFCLILLPFSGRLRKAARRWKSLVVLALVGAALAVGLSGCGSNSSLKAQSYTLTVTATSGSLSHETTLTLTVQ
jgi:hypothetical protein